MNKKKSIYSKISSKELELIFSEPVQNTGNSRVVGVTKDSKYFTAQSQLSGYHPALHYDNGGEEFSVFDSSNLNIYDLTLSPNGFIYSSPASGSSTSSVRRSIYKIDTDDVNLTYSLVYFLETPRQTTTPQVSALMLGENGNLYSIPRRLTVPIRIIDTTNDSVTDFTIPNTASDNVLYHGCVHGGNKFYIMCGRGNQGMHEYDYINGTHSFYPTTIASASAYPISGGALGQDGNVYYAPRRSEITSILKFNTTTKAFSTISLPFATFGDDKYDGFVVLPDGRFLTFGLTGEGNPTFIFDPLYESFTIIPDPIDFTLVSPMIHNYSVIGNKYFFGTDNGGHNLLMMEVNNVDQVISTDVPPLGNLATSDYNKYFN